MKIREHYCFEIVGGVFTIYFCFTSVFENNIIYALAIGGGMFLMMSGFEKFGEEYEKERIRKGNK